MIKKVMRKLVKVYYMYIAKSLQILRLHLVQSRG